MQDNQITFEKLHEIALLHEIDPDFYPVFATAALAAMKLQAGTVQQFTYSQSPVILATKNSDGKTFVLFSNEKLASKTNNYIAPFPYSLTIPGICISKYII